MKKVFDHNLSDIFPALFSKHSEVEDSTTTETTQNEFQQPTPTPAPSPSYHACGVHETSVSGDHSWVTPACGDSTHAGYACQIGSSHTNLQASCTATDSNGNSCTVTGFYTCSPHTHVYPAPPEPSLSTCANGHSYDPNNPSAYKRHHTKTCRFSECGQTWANCSGNAPICNKPYRKANGLRCWAID